ncbi:unnamed protein product, partial [Owenia fusiformis]
VDFIVGCSSSTFHPLSNYLDYMKYKPNGDINRILCFLRMTCIISSCMISLLSFNLIIIERLVRTILAQSYQKLFSRRKTLIYITVLWIYGISGVLGPMALGGYTWAPDNPCRIQLVITEPLKNFLQFNAGVLLLLNCSLLTTVFIYIKRSKRKIHTLQSNNIPLKTMKNNDLSIDIDKDGIDSIKTIDRPSQGQACCSNTGMTKQEITSQKIRNKVGLNDDEQDNLSELINTQLQTGKQENTSLNDDKNMENNAYEERNSPQKLEKNKTKFLDINGVTLGENKNNCHGIKTSSMPEKDLLEPRLTKTVFMIDFISVLCFLQYLVIFSLVESDSRGRSLNTWSLVVPHVSSYIVVGNSFINPFIYA